MRGSAQKGEVRGGGKFDITHYISASGKRPVQEPRRCTADIREVAVESGAKQPESKPAFILDAEIIARRSAVLAPPGAFDALRPFGGNHLVQRASPPESQRWAVRHFRYGFNRLRPCQQPQRAWRQINLFAVAAERAPAGI